MRWIKYIRIFILLVALASCSRYTDLPDLPSLPPQVLLHSVTVSAQVYTPESALASADVSMVPLAKNGQEEIPGELPAGIVPVLLEAPSIDLSTSVIPVGLLENGQMDVPKEFDRVGWFEPGIKPGEIGNAAIAGHLDHATGPAVFYNLRRLDKGDLIYVYDKNGRKLTFKVTSVETFKTEKAPLNRIFGDGDKARLNLITCAGLFNKQTHESSHRLVVFTELSPSND